jgi:hypothetical protein
LAGARVPDHVCPSPTVSDTTAPPARSSEDAASRARWRRIATSPLLQGAALFSGVAATLIVEEHARRIIDDLFRAAYGPRGPLSVLTAAVVGLTLFSVGVAVGGQFAHMRQGEEDQQRRSAAEADILARSAELQRSSDELVARADVLQRRSDEVLEQSRVLQQMVQSLPPANFVDRYGEQLVLAHATHVDASQVDPGSPGAVTELQEMLRAVLHAVGKVFAVYDNAESATIGVNVMLYVPAESLAAFDFDFAPLRPEEVEGALVVIRELSARTDLKDPVFDPALPELRLPIPHRKHLTRAGEEISCVLPGAPQAWVLRTTLAYRTLEQLMSACGECALPEGTEPNMRAYFRDQGRSVASFVSIPLISEESERPIGVLNVHSSQPGLLEARPLDLRMHALLKPLLAQIVDMLQLLAAAEQRAGFGVVETADPAPSPAAGTGVDGTGPAVQIPDEPDPREA